MTITIRRNNTNVEGIVINNNGYMFTIGPKNGVGKLYQPGTRGLVVDDSVTARTTMEGRPVFSISGSSPAHQVQYPTSRGYATAWVNNNNRVQAQTCVPADHYGMDDLILTWANNDPNYFALLPVSRDIYDIDASRWGDKPISGTYELLNSGGARGIITPNTTIYKWEAHVIISYKYKQSGQMTRVNLNNAVKAVYIPRVTSGGTYAIHQLSKIKHYSNPDSSLPVMQEYIYFRLENSTNLPGGTILAYPVIIWGDKYYTDDSLSPTFSVQTKFCFKND